MRSLPGSWILALLLAAQAARAAPPRIAAARVEPPAWASIEHPYRLAATFERAPRPAWTRAGLVADVPEAPFGLAGSAKPGMPAYDASADAWFATSEGCLVRLEPDGSLPVVVDGPQGIDLDVRAAKGVAVTREPDDTIVLWRFGGGRTVLLSGPQYFRPRFSPDGTRVLVAESRASGGHSWVVDLDGKAVDLGQSIGATWHPDGKRVVFVRTVHDGYVVLSSTVHVLELATRRERLLGRTQAPPLLEPAVSPDGRLVAFRSATDDAVLVAPLLDAPEGR